METIKGWLLRHWKVIAAIVGGYVALRLAGHYVPEIGAAMSLVLMGALYLLPGIIAITRNHRNAGAIMVLNILLGWTVVGWIGALVWASTNPAPAQVNTGA